MASVFNSNNTVYNLNSGDFIGRWEDIQSYTSVINTINIGVDTSGTARLEWINMGDDRVPLDSDTPLVTDSFVLPENSVNTKQFDARARWVRLRIEGTGTSLNQISTNYKKAPTEIKLTDDNTHIVSVNLGDNHLNSLYTVLTDISGVLLGTTNDTDNGEALYTHLTDASGHSLATTDNNRDIRRTLTSTAQKIQCTLDNLTLGASPSQGTFMVLRNAIILPKSEIKFKNGDIVHFIMTNSGDDGSDFLDGVFADTEANSSFLGLLKITAKVKYLEVDSRFVKFQLLVDQNMSDWFNPNIGLSALLPINANLGSMTTGDPNWTVSLDTIVYLKEASGNQLPTVQDYYNIIQDPNGFDLSYAGIHLNPGKYPIDLRFYQGSLAPRSVNHVYFNLVTRHDPLESLSVALRDASNTNLGSTGLGETGYYYKEADFSKRNILFLVDGTNGYGLDPQNKFNTLNVMYGDLTVSIDSLTTASKASSTALIQYGSTNFEVLKKPSDAWSTYTFAAETTDSPDYWSALAKYANPLDADFSGIFANNLNAIVMFTSSGEITNTPNRNVFDTCLDFFNRIDKYVIAPLDKSKMPSLLSFTGAQGNIFTYNSDTADANSFEQSIRPAVNSIFDRLAKVAHVGNNSLAVHTSDVCGHSQAGTRIITDAKFGTSALYYALADSCGTSLDTTMTVTDPESTNNNALYVSLVTRTNVDGTVGFIGKPVDDNYPLHITFEAAFRSGKIFDLEVSGVPVTTDDVSNATFNLNTLGIANETAATIWVKVYDISVGQYDLLRSNNDSASAMELSGNIVYNFAVPGLEYRDLQFAHPVKFAHGMYLVASTNYRYDNYDYPPGNKHIFVHGNYTLIDS